MANKLWNCWFRCLDSCISQWLSNAVINRKFTIDIQVYTKWLLVNLPISHIYLGSLKLRLVWVWKLANAIFMLCGVGVVRPQNPPLKGTPSLWYWFDCVRLLLLAAHMAYDWWPCGHEGAENGENMDVSLPEMVLLLAGDINCICWENWQKIYLHVK